MPDLSQTNPTGRFAGLAKIYSKCRPGYPQSALNFILQHCDLKSGSLLVDVGSGTGISSRLFAERGLQVVGIEPNRLRTSSIHRAAEQNAVRTSAAQADLGTNVWLAINSNRHVVLLFRSLKCCLGQPVATPRHR